ncbi:uncharacterized protein LOC119899810 [Micropterus salmoides]|uniref:uncharacterized protein LOC119899810 n=1 Tax=Micropterus salmoides TaxID=27706 RepID=UPI0018EAC5D9|nr:uncharacterized protein LOC119899810 [Micropterus salmoides]XP_038570506.1 uncharacterized protein LOC119899810 [Micropterus salmoides]XP_038570507.1 uncharacterized protein LOC119899810 [Micropterus salmoides]XP_038570508.1 uncharacterized protein LOC119899810 [Micropterus salmoides]XP_038570509.1 uncharacterized protein LOC119899810 [Micropterus salmoides]
MVMQQLCTLEHLMNSGFGRPFPRHGLQLLFWFANHCVTWELINCVVIMKLVSDCQPENGVYGFHRFGNIEELLPVLDRPRKSKSKRKLAYFEVGNLNTETYPASANLPTYVRENYGLYGNCSNYNIDRIIISYQVRTRVVEMVYVTEHDGAAFGRFSPDRTYEISSELIQTLQSLQLDLDTFLTHTGYWGDLQVVQSNHIEEIHHPEPSAQQMFNMVQTYSGCTARTEQRNDLRFFSEAFNQQLDVNMEPFGYDQQVQYVFNVTSHNSALVTNYSEVQYKHMWPEARDLRPSYWLSGWKNPYRGFDEEAKKRNGGGGFSLFKILLSAGVLYLAAKCFGWLRNCCKVDLNENVLKMIPWRTPSYQQTHIMLDYVY